MAQEPKKDTQNQKPKEPTEDAKDRRPKYDWSDAVMLLIIMASLTGVVLGGIAIIVTETNFRSADVVAIISPPLGVISTVAAGVFGYSLGTRGTAEAQRTATAATQQAVAAREDAATAVAPPARDIGRIVRRAREGGEVSPGTYGISVDDLNTLLSDVVPLASRLGMELPSPIAPPTPGGRPPQGQPGQ